MSSAIGQATLWDFLLPPSPLAFLQTQSLEYLDYSARSMQALSQTQQEALTIIANLTRSYSTVQLQSEAPQFSDSPSRKFGKLLGEKPLLAEFIHFQFAMQHAYENTSPEFVTAMVSTQAGNNKKNTIHEDLTINEQILRDVHQTIIATSQPMGLVSGNVLRGIENAINATDASTHSKHLTLTSSDVAHPTDRSRRSIVGVGERVTTSLEILERTASTEVESSKEAA